MENSKEEGDVSTTDCGEAKNPLWQGTIEGRTVVGREGCISLSCKPENTILANHSKDIALTCSLANSRNPPKDRRKRTGKRIKSKRELSLINNSRISRMIKRNPTGVFISSKGTLFFNFPI